LLPAPPTRPTNVAPPLSHPSVIVSSDPQPAAAAHVEEPELIEPLSPELQLTIAFEVLHHLEMAEKSRSLSAKELDLVSF
jgi:hypothetical protein